MTIEEFDAKKKRLDALKESIAKNTGAYEQTMASLMEYGTATIEEADKLLAGYKEKEAINQVELSALLAEFEGLTDAF